MAITQKSTSLFEKPNLRRMAPLGGPLLIPGFESPFVAVQDFQSNCHERLKALMLELEEYEDMGDDYSDISVEELKIVTDSELVEKALQETMLPQEVPAPKKKRRRKQDSKPNVKVVNGRPCDRDVRAKALELDATNESIITALKQSRDAERNNALASLNSLRSTQERVKVEEDISLRRKRSLGALKYSTSILNTPKECSNSSEGTIDQSEVMLCIDFHKSSNMKVQEFIVLGSQPLTALRDELYCLTDELASKENTKVPSGFFFIEDVFYNDMRDPEASDYSEPILEWLKGNEGRKSIKSKSSSSSSSLRAQSMEGTYFRDLKVKLGAKYIYCHQGDCKHVMVIKDLRLPDAEDVKEVSAYPLLKFLPRLRHRKCSVCEIYRAKKVSYDDKLGGGNPYFFCNNCYFMLHYTEDGTLLYDDFKVFDYYHE